MTRRTKTPSPPHPQRIPGGEVMLWLGVAVFLLSVAAGVWRSWTHYHTLPQVGVEYNTELNALIRQRGEHDALRQIRSAATIDFDNELAVNRLRDSAREAGDVEGLTIALLALVRLKPEDAEVRNELASALLSQGRVVEAKAQAEFAARLAPDSPDAHCNLGAALLGLGEKRSAAAAYRKALELDPQSETAQRALQFPLQGY